MFFIYFSPFFIFMARLMKANLQARSIPSRPRYSPNTSDNSKAVQLLAQLWPCYWNHAPEQPSLHDISPALKPNCTISMEIPISIPDGDLLQHQAKLQFNLPPCHRRCGGLLEEGLLEGALLRHEDRELGRQVGIVLFCQPISNQIDVSIWQGVSEKSED